MKTLVDSVSQLAFPWPMGLPALCTVHDYGGIAHRLQHLPVLASSIFSLISALCPIRNKESLATVLANPSPITATRSFILPPLFHPLSRFCLHTEKIWRPLSFCASLPCVRSFFVWSFFVCSLLPPWHPVSLDSTLPHHPMSPRTILPNRLASRLVAWFVSTTRNDAQHGPHQRRSMHQKMPR